jgi:hypothetical protein
MAAKAVDWQNSRGCWGKIAQCFSGEGYTLTLLGLGAVACAGNCYATTATNGLLIRSCVTSCATAAAVTTHVLEKCYFDAKNQCKGDDLEDLKQMQLTCRK